MPTKPRIVRGHRFTHKKGRLAQRTRDELIHTAGLDPSSPDALVLIIDVEGALSDAANLRDSVERGPTSAGQAALLHDVEKAAHALERALLDLDQGSLVALDSPFVDAQTDTAVVKDLVDLRDACRELRTETLKGSRRGRIADDSRDEAIRLLSAIFHEQADPSINGEYGSALLSFIATALEAAQFVAPGVGKRASRLHDRTEGRKTWQRVPDEFKKPRKKRP
jgi:hypothetical protein